MGLFSVKEGLKIIGSQGNAVVLNGTDNPASTGITAPLGSLYLKSDGLSFKKTGAADTDWLSYGEIESAGLIWQTATDALTCTEGNGYILDSSTSAFTITLPADPAIGDVVGFAGLGSLETNNVTVSMNSKNLNGSTDDLVIDLNFCYFEMLYTGDATTGWVISNTDESGNVDNIRTFIGNSDNTNPGSTEFSVGNYVANGDPLDTAIDKLDIALKSTNDLAATGVSWGACIKGATSDQIQTGTDAYTAGTYFTDDTDNKYGRDQWVDGDKFLSIHTATLGNIYTWTAATTEFVLDRTLGANDAVSVSYDFPDDPASQEDGAAYMMNAAQDTIVKIADFDMDSAATVGISSGYTPGAGDVSAVDSVESAIQKLDGNADAMNTLLGVGQGDTDLGNSGMNYVTDGATVPGAIANLDNSLKTLEDTVLGVNTTNVTNSGSAVTVDTVAQAGNLGATWEVIAYDGSGNRYAGKVYALHAGTSVDFTEFAILTLGTAPDVAFSVTADGTTMTLQATNTGGAAIDIRTQRVLIQSA